MARGRKSNPIQKPRSLITYTNSKSYISEQFRTIRTNIHFALPNREFRTLLVTSSLPGEGKSTSAANIAIVFAQEGKKVLLVDADMRKPIIHHTFYLENTVGYSNVLAGQTNVEDAIQITSVEGLDIITSGPIPPNPTELLSSSHLDEFMAKVRSKYEIIIFDAPPITAVSDALILGNKCDGTVLIVDSSKVKKADVIKAKDSLDTSRANLIGFILNNYKMPKNEYYY